MDDLASLVARQSGVVSRRQCREAGLRDCDIRRRLRRREWALVHPGVYVDHTGLLTWRQRAWAAVLAMAPAALCHRSAVRAVELTGTPGAADDGRPLHVAVDRDRAVHAPTGVVCHRIADFETRILTTASPPRQRYEDAVIDVAARAATTVRATAVLADAVGTRHTTAERLRTALDQRSRMARRALLAGVLDDVAAGTCSVLEHGFLVRVERAHGLPTASRQVRESTRGTVYRDVAYAGHGLREALLVELDGRIVHGEADTFDADLERDLLAAVSGRTTVRLGWGQVFDRACATAAAVGLLLTDRGWAGALRRCPDCPEADEDSGGSESPGDLDPPLSA